MKLVLIATLTLITLTSSFAYSSSDLSPEDVTYRYILDSGICDTAKDVAACEDDRMKDSEVISIATNPNY